MKRILKTLVLLLGLAASSEAGAANFVSARIPAGNAPQIDGKLTPGEYDNAARLADFSDAAGRKLSEKTTESYVTYDRQNLYFAFRAEIDFESWGEKLPHDSSILSTVDSIEIMLVPDGEKDIRRFVFDRNGTRLDQRFEQGVKCPPERWNPNWQVVCKLQPRDFFASSLWEAEVSIPWSTLGLTDTRPGTRLAVQIARNIGDMRQSPELRNRTSCWSPCPSVWDLMDRNRFGTFQLGGELPVFRFEKYGDFNHGSGGLQGRLCGSGTAEYSVTIQNLNGGKLGGAKGKTAAGSLNVPIKPAITAATDVLLRWNVSDQAGSVATGETLLTLKPAFSVEFGPIFSRQEVVFVGDLSQMTRNQPLKIRLKLTQDAESVEKIISIAPGLHTFREALSFSAFRAGRPFSASAELLPQGGITPAITSREIAYPTPPTWMQTPPVTVTAPVGNFRPVEISSQNGQTGIRILKNSYWFGKQPLPQRIDLLDRPFTDRPMQFTVVTAQGRQVFDRNLAATVLEQTPRGAVLQYRGESPELELQAKITVEFDGLAWYELTLTPKNAKVTLEHLSIDFSAFPDKIRYMRGQTSTGTLQTSNLFALAGKGKTTRPIPRPALQLVNEISGNGWKFQNSFCNFYWIGDEDAGMFCIFPSQRNTKIRKEYTTVTDNADTFQVKFNLVDTTLPLSQPRTYCFGMALTPSKERPNPDALRKVGAASTGFLPDRTRRMQVERSRMNTWGWRFFHDKELKPFPKDYFTTCLLPCWLLPTIQNGNPFPDDKELAVLKTEIAGINNSIGGMPTLWYDALFSMFQLPHAIDYQYEFERYPQTRIRVEKYGTLICPTETWRNYYLEGVRSRIKDGIRSFYMDMTNLGPCSNQFHGCGYYDEDGKLQGEIPFLAARELFLSYQKLVKENDPNGLVMIHMSPLSPLALWLDLVIRGEEWLSAPDLSTLSPEFYQASLMCSRQLGTQTLYFPAHLLLYYRIAASSSVTVTLAEVCGLTFLHGESMYQGVPEMLPGLRMVWDELDKFGIDAPETVWTPYYRNPLSRYPDGVAVSSWERNGRRLLVLFNPEYRTRSIELNLPPGRAHDLLSGQALPPEPVVMAKRDFKLILIEPQKQ